eukprot:TRINITY_DN5200_c0_g1_i1.p2 TRINITY_DN5200_c0_g1~~TRINITY_DN5200_c0_g1_i1.p2  ORF type:complete len:119 (+),score=20.83 TRINITY_DN5200_c0_g1_i1:95-451(+)
MALFDEVDNELKLMVCAAYGDLEGILSYTGTPPELDAHALMVAVANHQTHAADLLKSKFPQLTGKTTKSKWIWRQATHKRNNTNVYLPWNNFGAVWWNFSFVGSSFVGSVVSWIIHLS